MKKIFTLILSLCLVGLVALAATSYTPTYFPGGIKIGPHKQGIQPYLLQLENPSGVTKFSVDNQGRVNQDDIVLIDNINDLTNYSSGSSIFRMQWGKHYIVDPYAINASGSGLAPGGTTTIRVFTGVTAILPYATSSNSAYQPSIVEMRTVGVTGYAISGGTPVTVWAPVNPGATRYAVDGGVAVSGASYQTVYVMVGGHYRKGPDPSTSLTSGGSIWGISRPGESITFEYLHNSGTSVIITNNNLYDVAGE